MDPVTTVILIILFVLAGGGASGAAIRARKKEQKRLLKDAVRARTRVVGGTHVSIFDLFWDLGVSDYALEIMGTHGLLLVDIQDLPQVRDRLADLVEVHGSYEAFVRENLETIQEFYNEHRHAGNRRNVPALETRERKTLQLAAPDAERTSQSARGTGNLPVPYTGKHLPVVARDIDDRIAARQGGGGLMPLETSMTGLEVDVDELTSVNPMEMLKSIFDGNIATELERWWEMRTLRSLRTELDRHLSRLYDFYADQTRRNPQLLNHLYDTSRR